MSAYFPSHSAAPAAFASAVPSTSPHALAMPSRYPLSAQALDQRTMSGGRHKKEIKRRTKTGCLTCRKRRIKCDEAHPICRNCQKSKRDCLGYDPIFKQQPGPATIQPAPSSSSGQDPKSSISISTSSYPSTPAAYPSSTSTSFATASAADPALDYGASIDPALATVDTAPLANPLQAFDNTTPKTTMGPSSPFAQIATLGPHAHKAKRVRLDDLFALNDVPPDPLPGAAASLPRETLDEIQLLYRQQYAPYLDKFLETSWYTRRGEQVLFESPGVCAEFAHVLSLFQNGHSDSYEMRPRIRSAEARLVWDLFGLCRAAAPVAANGSATELVVGGVSGASPDDFLEETRHRLAVLESLLTGAPLDRALVPAGAVYPQADPDAQTAWFAAEFWRLLAIICATPHHTQQPGADSSDPHANLRLIDSSLNAMRNILQLLENRDVIYSIAVARFYGPSVPGFPESVGLEVLDGPDTDPRTKVVVAKKFIEDEAAGKGMSQVVQRVCGMAVWSWELWKRDG